MTILLTIFGFFYLAIAIPSGYLALKHGLMRIAYLRCLSFLVFALALVFTIETFTTAVIFWALLHATEAIANSFGYYEKEQPILIAEMRKTFFGGQ